MINKKFPLPGFFVLKFSYVNNKSQQNKDRLCVEQPFTCKIASVFKIAVLSHKVPISLTFSLFIALYRNEILYALQNGF